MSRPPSDETLAFLPVTQLARLIETRAVTPSELTELYLARLAKYDPQLHCVVSLTPDLARAQARDADREIAAGTLAWTQDTVGPLCRSAEDCALVFDAIYGPDGKDNTVLDVPFGMDLASDVRTLRVGYLRSLITAPPGETPLQEATRRNCENALAVIRGMGVEVVPFDMPAAEVAALELMRWAETGAAFDTATRNGVLREIENGPEQSQRPADIRAGRFITAVDYIQANRYRMRLMEQMAAALSQLDLFVGEASTVTNRLGYPMVTVLSGCFDGSPTGLVMTGKLFGDAELLRLAHAYQVKIERHRQHPAIQA